MFEGSRGESGCGSWSARGAGCCGGCGSLSTAGRERGVAREGLAEEGDVGVRGVEVGEDVGWGEGLPDLCRGVRGGMLGEGMARCRLRRLEEAYWGRDCGCLMGHRGCGGQDKGGELRRE